MPISSDEHCARVTSSMLWSAWADALGFISELVDEAGVRRRTKGNPLNEPMAWTRRVGGRSGPNVLLPAGTYSDDTQLRLAVARSIGGSMFDVEAFARVELTVWQSYALGGGRGTKAAAKNMAKPRAFWAANFFPGWTQAGGNGAAMRIHPHVWASPEPDQGSYLNDLISDAIVTHGHVRGVLGAVLNGVFLAEALASGKQADPTRWEALLEKCLHALDEFTSQDELSAYWIPRWERDSQETLVTAWRSGVNEVSEQLHGPGAQFLRRNRGLSSLSGLSVEYEGLLHDLDLYRPENRGSGTATVVAAIVLAAVLPESPADVGRVAASAIGSDTDTIGTMAAALVGASSGAPFYGDLQDQDYLTSEAFRLSEIATGRSSTAPIRYPDLLKWEPPKVQSDSVGRSGSTLVLAGLGPVNPVGETYPANDFGWTWMQALFGPTFLLKHRLEVLSLSASSLPSLSPPEPQRSSRQVSTISVKSSEPPPSTEIQLDIESLDHQPAVSREPLGAEEVPQILDWLDGQGFADGSVGYAIRRVAERGTARQFATLTEAVRRRLNTH